MGATTMPNLLFRAAPGLCLAALLAVLPVVGSAATVPFRIDPLPGSSTFSGTGSVSFEAPVSGPSDIDALSVRIATEGTVSYDDPDGGYLPSLPITHVFVFGPDDVSAVSGLAMTPEGGLTGSISFFAVVSENDLITMGGFTLDFDASRASGFCYYNDILSECIAGGGTSSGGDAVIVAPAAVPLPAALPLLALGTVMLGGLRRTRRSTQA